MDEEDLCPICYAPVEYDELWDAEFCMYCNEWLEEGCGHLFPECAFECLKRPEKPM